MAKGTNFSRPLRKWHTSWKTQTDGLPARIQWQNSTQDRGANRHDGSDQGAWEWTPSGRTRIDVLLEHDLDRDGQEYILFKNWTNGTFPPKATDRTGFVKLQEEVQEPGSNEALRSLKNLLGDYMEFDEDDRLAPRMLYHPQSL